MDWKDRLAEIYEEKNRARDGFRLAAKVDLIAKLKEAEIEVKTYVSDEWVLGLDDTYYLFVHDNSKNHSCFSLGASVDRGCVPVNDLEWLGMVSDLRYLRELRIVIDDNLVANLASMFIRAKEVVDHMIRYRDAYQQSTNDAVNDLVFWLRNKLK